MASVIVLCIFVHFLVNIEKRVAFNKVVKSVGTHLEAERENRKQVCMHMLTVCVTMVTILYTLYMYML